MGDGEWHHGQRGNGTHAHHAARLRSTEGVGKRDSQPALPARRAHVPFGVQVPCLGRRCASDLSDCSGCYASTCTSALQMCARIHSDAWRYMLSLLRPPPPLTLVRRQVTLPKATKPLTKTTLLQTAHTTEIPPVRGVHRHSSYST